MWIKGSFPEDVMLKYSSMPNYGVQESGKNGVNIYLDIKAEINPQEFVDIGYKFEILTKL